MSIGGDEHEEGDEHQSIDNAPIAFVLVMFAGLATGLGAAFVFNNRMVSSCVQHPSDVYQVYASLIMHARGGCGFSGQQR